MQPLNVVVLQSDPRTTEQLLATLEKQFNSIHAVRAPEELWQAIPKYRAQVIILDMEASSLAAVTRLRREFPQLSLVCTHRLADEDMWTEIIAAGGNDLCGSGDTQGIVSAVLRSTGAATHSAAA
ncbi:MAG TPA: hypothetical protein VFA76_02750 [Terriglobales bacterium]|nr:hypothetical protein [Terriglobales bacterium]